MSMTLTRPAPAPVETTPESPIPLSTLVRVEWSKATDTRAARWLIGAAAFATVAIMLLPLLRPGAIEQSWSSYLTFAATGISLLLPVVAIMNLTSEWTQRSVLSTFTQEPRRGRVIRAKVLVSLIMGVAAIVFAAVVCGAAVLVATAFGRHISDDLSAGVVVGFALFVLLNIMMGVAFGALLHNTAASIVLFFLLPTLFGILGSAVSVIGHWFDTATTFSWVQNGQWSGHTPQILTSVAVWVAVPLALGLVRTARREIK